jgi:hypothetical protein
LTAPLDVTKVPAVVTAAVGTPTAPPAEQGPQSAANAAPLADRADIRPLDIPAALRILLAEVRGAFELQAVAMSSDASEAVNTPPQTARALLQMFLGALQDESLSVPAWNAVLLRVETALQTGLDRGIAAVTVWRDVPPIVVAAAQETRSLVFSALGDDAVSPAWLRPEWAGLAPRLERFWRRWRRARRQLTDPDHSSWSFDDGSERRN